MCTGTAEWTHVKEVWEKKMNWSHARYAANLDHVDSLRLSSQWQPMLRLHPIAHGRSSHAHHVRSGVVIMTLLSGGLPDIVVVALMRHFAVAHQVQTLSHMHCPSAQRIN